jgi:hypothetical protein
MSEKVCPRCKANLRSWTTSYFNLEDICLDCALDERSAPNFSHARAREEAEVRQGNYNYRGLGLAPDDRAFLQERIRERGTPAAIGREAGRRG